jgi:hypothetical protein
MLYVTFQNVRERSSAIFKGRKLHQTDRLSAPIQDDLRLVVAPALCVRSRPRARGFEGTPTMQSNCGLQ